MGDPVPVITAVTALVVAVGAFVLNLLRGQAAERAAVRAADEALAARVAIEESKAEIILVGDRVVEVGKQIDGRMEELLRAARAAARAEGVAAGEQSQRDRANPTAQP